MLCWSGVRVSRARNESGGCGCDRRRGWSCDGRDAEKSRARGAVGEGKRWKGVERKGEERRGEERRGEATAAESEGCRCSRRSAALDLILAWLSHENSLSCISFCGIAFPVDHRGKSEFRVRSIGSGGETLKRRVARLWLLVAVSPVPQPTSWSDSRCHTPRAGEWRRLRLHPLGRRPQCLSFFRPLMRSQASAAAFSCS